MKNKCMVVVIKSEAVTAAKTTTTTTFQSSNKTCDLFTGDLVSLDGFSKKTDGRMFKVLAHTEACCESGTMLSIQATGNAKEKYALDRYWLVLDTRASALVFDDDIPF